VILALVFLAICFAAGFVGGYYYWAKLSDRAMSREDEGEIRKLME